MQIQKLYEKFLELKQKNSSALLEMGEILWELEKNRAWEQMNFADFTELVTTETAAGGLEMDKADASKLKGVHQHYIVGGIATQEQLTELGSAVYKFYEARELVKSPQDLELLRLPLSEIKLMKKQQDKSLDELSRCQHQNLTPLWHCPDCGEYFHHDPKKKG